MITLDQALTCNEFHLEPCLKTIGKRGRVKIKLNVWRRNGKTKTWKRDLERFLIPIKHGLYHHGYLINANAQVFHTSEDCYIKETL